MWVALFLCLLAAQHVLERTSADFDTTVQDNKKGTLVYFYAPWCGHCKQFSPEFERAAVLLSKHGSDVQLIKVDATLDTEDSEARKVLGFPTVRLHFNDTWIDYEGGRTDDSIVSWVLKKTGQAASEIQTVAELLDFVKNYSMTAVYFGADPVAVEVYIAASKDIHDVMFAVAAPAVIADIGGAADVLTLARDKLKEGYIAMFYPHDAKFDILEPTKGIVIQSEVEQFVRGHRLPIVVRFSGEVSEDLFNDPRPLLFLFYDSVRPEDLAAEAVFREVAPELTKSVSMSTVGVIEPMDQRLMDFIGVEASEAPTMCLVTNPMGAKKRYKFTEKVWTPEAIRKYVQEAKDGKIAPYYKSQPIPSEQTESVLTIVGNSFKELVIDSPKNVVVQFYAPWCGHCKAMKPAMKELGDTYQNSPTVVIGKFDATMNDAVDVEVIGFPLIKIWLAKDKGTPVEYDGAWDFPSISAWIDAQTAATKDEL